MKKQLLCAAAFMLSAAAMPASAASAAVERAKDQCVVGEQADGYIGVVSGKSADNALRREIADINQQRKSVYADLARRNGVTIEVTAALTAEKLMNQATSGQCIRDQSGTWRQI
ncbi:YdbL family protein [Hyphococcus sp.]|uniref:YdbL family protein n=1 Tax=Hyphococcus sp. TaxID=2038636 RepID=UPI003CCB7CAB